MKDLYKKNEYCMDFDYEEVLENIIEPYKDHLSVNIYYEYETDHAVGIGKKHIKFVSFDGKKEGFYIRFYKHLTAIFIHNQEFMFIDDDAKKHHTSSETYGNIVYEGTLRDKTHKEILAIIMDFVKILIGTKKILIKETQISQEGFQYPKCRYDINIYNESGIEEEIKFKNIVFYTNK